MARYNTVTPAGSVSTTATISTPNQGLFTELTGTAPYTVTLANPASYPGIAQTFYNATSGTVTLSTPSGTFSGLSSTSYALTTGNVIVLQSDGTNYIPVVSSGGTASVTTLTSTVSTGTAPFTVSSTTQVNNLNASYLQGLQLGNNGSAVGANAILRSDSSGYIWTSYINCATANSENPSVSQVIVTNGTDGYYRKSSISSFTSAVQSNASGTWSITAATANALASGNSYSGVNFTGSGYIKGGPNAGPSNPTNFGLQASGAYGGGVAFIDGSYGIGLYSVTGTLNFGLGSNTAISSVATLDVNGNLTINGNAMFTDYIVITGNISLPSTYNRNYLIVSTAAYTLTLPASPANGRNYTFIDASNGLTQYNTTISPQGGNTIAGAAGSITLDQNGATATLVYYNGDWKVVGY